MLRSPKSGSEGALRTSPRGNARAPARPGAKVAEMVATAVEHEHSVTPWELFFALVFVFAFTQVPTLLSDDPTFAGIGRGVLVVAALWWPWTAYAWLTNTVDPEEALSLIHISEPT